MSTQTNLKDAVGHGLKANATVIGYLDFPYGTNDYGGANKVFPPGSDLGLMYESNVNDVGVEFIHTYDPSYVDYFIPFGEYLFTLYDGSRLTAYGSNSGVKPGPDPDNGGDDGSNDDDNGSGTGNGSGDGTKGPGGPGGSNDGTSDNPLDKGAGLVPLFEGVNALGLDLGNALGMRRLLDQLGKWAGLLLLAAAAVVGSEVYKNIKDDKRR